MDDYDVDFDICDMIDNILADNDDYFNLSRDLVNSIIDIILDDTRTRINVVCISPYRFSEFGNGHSDDLCSICFEINKESTKLPCGHHYHKGCISKWLLEKSVYCPMCKFDCRYDAIHSFIK